ncbi:LPXTG cell wall anchor domain-containing protein [uncultured Gemmiger sp.]|uniref:LPXTG cell wall anchor domain-containing protein n=1 Tax=uncultured Gemmiger sp. TaxID=1623490 RepID=UPI0025D71CE0|nr:LPXTG cell wall anchor domain-containing protein [uncultured Gemmiger sp.]
MPQASAAAAAQTAARSAAIPATGDSTPLALWTVLCLASLAGFAALLVLKKKHRN